MTPACFLWALAATDLLVCGLWLALRPGDLFGLLGMSPIPDGVFLARLFGGVLAGEGLCLVLAMSRPGWRSLAWPALWGRVLEVGMGLFLLGTDRVALPRSVLAGFVGDAAVGLALVGAGVVASLRDAKKRVTE
jgi:hypothetical protein